MNLFRLTYPSGPYRVVGYLGLPGNLSASEDTLAKALHDHYEVYNLNVTKLSDSYAPSATRIQFEPAPDDKYPVLIYCRGGMGKFGSVRTKWMESFCRHGYIVFAPCYRGNEGGEGRDEFGGADLEDVASTYRFLQQLVFVNPAEISIMGFSRGAINAAQAASQLKDVHRLILWGGVSDLAQTYEQRVDLRRMLKRVLGGTPSKVPEAYQFRSPALFAPDLNCPVLVIHGEQDTQVDIEQGRTMYRVLKSLNKQVWLHSYPQSGHIFADTLFEKAVNRMMTWIREL
ncbi:S9 family peptidase [Paenibacillus sp. CAA11]|uniref:alpha/beta hydrolase family protein n=1 Tax=Paenibacillus sp. CAA11 TaxID=1532905 RepID=UPI000D3572EC|nr:prolyl oligopeptidase family serine peptidase [Paenibacillus sp. CAA11]AWB44211.1 S9 family peptidase [Paenibacillus sp. CAA11]